MWSTVPNFDARTHPQTRTLARIVLGFCMGESRERKEGPVKVFCALAPSVPSLHSLLGLTYLESQVPTTGSELPIGDVQIARSIASPSIETCITCFFAARGKGKHTRKQPCCLWLFRGPVPRSCARASLRAPRAWPSPPSAAHSAPTPHRPSPTLTYVGTFRVVQLFACGVLCCVCVRLCVRVRQCERVCVRACVMHNGPPLADASHRAGTNPRMRTRTHARMLYTCTDTHLHIRPRPLTKPHARSWYTRTHAYTTHTPTRAHTHMHTHAHTRTPSCAVQQA